MQKNKETIVLESGNKIIKEYAHVDLLNIEREKLLSANRIAKETNLFMVPEILNCSLEKKTLELGFLDNLIPLNMLTLSNNNMQELFRKVGNSLGVIHQKLNLNEKLIEAFPEEWNRDFDNVFVHGDFTCVNVCYQKTSGKIVILDWLTSHLIGAQYTCCSRYFDLLWFVWLVFNIYKSNLFFSWKPKVFIDSFLRGYFEVTELQLDKERFDFYKKKINLLKIQKMHQYISNSVFYKKYFIELLFVFKQSNYNKYLPGLLNDSSV